MRASPVGIDLIKRFEGLRLKAYKCAAGVWTIGYGHTRDVKPGATITAHQADAILDVDLDAVERQVMRNLAVSVAPHEFDALVSFTFNLGEAALARSSLLRKLNTEDRAGAAEEFSRWRFAGGRELRGLVKRRAAERALFLGET
jgi:lysozyme